MLAGCSGGGPGSGLLGSEPVTGQACPNIAVLDAPGELTRFGGASPGALNDLLFQARMDVTDAFCEITDKATFVTAEAKISIARGPAETKGEVRFAFFVAVLDGQRNVILRDAFPLIVQFKKDETHLDYKDSFTIQIDRKPGIDPSSYSVYGGFEMTPDELEFSRRRRN